MVRRSVIAVLWFVAVALAYELFWSLTDAPRLVGPAIALLAASLVAWRWTPQAPRTIRL